MSDQALTTKLRDHYLQALGIVQYVPRDLASEEVVDSLVERSPVDENADMASQAQSVKTKSIPQSTIDTLFDGNDEDTVSKQSAKAFETPSKIQQKADKLTLQLVFWQPTDELLIVTAVDHELPETRQIKLLTKIVSAIDDQVSSLPPYDSANWPPHASMQGGEQEAREFLSTLINTRLAAKPIKLLLMLGESAHNWLLSKEQKNAAKDDLVPMNSDVTALIIPSLNDMLSQPQSKRLAWRAICQYTKLKA